jgi:hypothetical protein
MKCCIDRIEGDFFVLEDENKNFFSVKKTKLPLNAKPGDIVSYTDDVFVILEEETKRQKEEMFKLQNSLFE